nr:hypothetical protein [Tanacetum cinerariifolium]
MKPEHMRLLRNIRTSSLETLIALNQSRTYKSQMNSPRLLLFAGISGGDDGSSGLIEMGEKNGRKSWERHGGKSWERHGGKIW